MALCHMHKYRKNETSLERHWQKQQHETMEVNLEALHPRQRFVVHEIKEINVIDLMVYSHKKHRANVMEHDSTLLSAHTNKSIE